MRLLLAGLLCCVFWTAQAQRNDSQKLARQDVKKLSRIYQLDKAQKKAVLIVQERYYERLNEISSLKARDQYPAYLYKLKAVREGRNFELKQQLRAEQWPVFEAEIARQQKAYLNKLAALKSSGATKEEMELAKIAIE